MKWSALEIEDAACIDFLSLPVEFQGRKLDKKKRAKIKDVCMLIRTIFLKKLNHFHKSSFINRFSTISGVSFCPSEEICIRLCNFLGIRKILQAFEAHLKEVFHT